MLWIDAETVTGLLPMSGAIDALEAALIGGLDPSADPPRDGVDTQHGQLLLMPAEIAGWAGVKIVSIAPGNAERGLPSVQGIYVLLDAETLSPVALLDGSAITSLRTPAMSAVAVRHLAAEGACRLVVFGTGPQAWGHVAALRAVRPITEVVVVGRDGTRAQSFVDRLAGTGVAASRRHNGCRGRRRPGRLRHQLGPAPVRRSARSRTAPASWRSAPISRSVASSTPT